MLKIVCFWVSIILRLICIIAQNSLLCGLRFCIFDWVVFLVVVISRIVHFTAVIMPNSFFFD
jgi:hypothetical protein